MLTIPPPCPLPLHILRPAGLLLPLFLPQDVVNALSDLLGFFHFLFQREIPLIECFPLGGQLGILRFPCLYRQGGLALSKGRGVSPLPLCPVPVRMLRNRKPPENQSVKLTFRFRAANRILFDCQSVECLVDCMILCSSQSYLICPIRQSGWASQIDTMSFCCSTAAWYPSGSNPIKRTE